MARFRKSMAIAMALVMAGSMACMYPVNAGGMQRVYAAEADADASADESQTADIAASSGLGVAIHTPAQIKTYIKNSGSLLTDEVQYKTAYSDKTPYDPGSLTDETLNSALATLNIVRYIAGLNYNVTLDSSYNEQSQAAALISQINGTLNHSPTRPDGMSDSLYSLANTGCGHTNLAMGSANLNTCIVNSWMNDSSASNISHVGHRSWCLNPKMGKTGFGAAGNYMAMYSMNSSNSSNIKNIAWPAQNMPVEYFSSDRAWSLFTGQSETSSSVKVTLERKSDGKKWTFSESSSDGYFNVSDYIHNGTIVFRPSDIDGYNDGDVFTVNVTGVKTPVTYTVTFFSIGELGHVHTFNGAFNSIPDFTNMTAEVSAKCDGCGKTFTDSVDITITSSGVSCGYSGSLWYSYKPKFAGKTYSASDMDRVTSLPHLNGEPIFTWNGAECTAAQTCSRCGEETTTPCTVTSTTTATCTSAGTTTYTATLGKYSSVKNVASTKLSHKYTNYISDDNATCIHDGTKTAECDYGCGTTDTITDEGSKLEHKYTNYVSNDDADCQQAGTKTAECDYGCGTTKTVTDEDNPQRSHSFTNYVSDDNATCEQDGTKTAECDYGCGTTDTITDEGSKLEHKYTNYVSNDDADCQQAGTKTAECDYGCGTTKTVTDEDNPQRSHSFTNYVSDDNATCEQDGTKTAECDYGCGTTDTVTDEGSKLEHKYTHYVSNGDATCQQDGTKTAECDYGCGATDTVTDEGSKLEHKYTHYVSNGDATCQQDGTKTAECDYGCGTTDTVTDEGSKLEHKYTHYVSNDDATCQHDGTKTAECDYGCGTTDTVTDAGSKIPHSFTKFVSNDDATCQHDGTKTAECDYGCGETKTVDDVDSPKKSHSFTNYISDNNATCTERGTMTAECDYGCGEKNVILDENSVLADHKYSKYVSDDNATCQHDGTKTAECDYGCGTTKTVTDKGSQLEHTPVGEWIVTRKASPEEDGAMARKCKVCGDTVEGAKIPSIDRMVLDSTRFVYDGKAKKTGVIIYDRTGAEIDASQYTLKFEKNTASGRASVKAVFSDDYMGTLTTYFNIMPKGTSVRALANSTAGVSITWNKAVDGTGYYIYRSTNGRTYTQIAAINKLTTTSYTDKTAKTNGARYLYKVCVYRKNASLILKSSSSAPKTIYYVTAPTCRSAANSAAGSIKVNYTGNTKATGYQIQYALNTKFTGAKTVTAAGYKTTTKVITKLQKNKKYYVRVRGYKKVKGVVYYSAWSTAKSVVVKK